MAVMNVGILLFDDVELLDFAGPFEVFSRTRTIPGIDSRRSDQDAPFQVFTVASTNAPVTVTGGLKVLPTYTFDTCPNIDILVIPGGFGTRTLLEDENLISWIQSTASTAQQTASVCTGALLLAKAGLLTGRRATTHWGALDTLEAMDKNIRVERTLRVVHDQVITSGGIAAGIDMAFYIVAELFGNDVADDTAKYMEYKRADLTNPT